LLNPYPARYRPAFACSRILYPLPRPVALRLPFPDEGSPGEGNGLTTFRMGQCPGEVGGASPPVVQHLRGVSSEHPNLTTHLFGPSLSASLACSLWRRFIALHGMFTLSPLLVPDRLDAGSRRDGSRLCGPSR